MKYLHEKFFDFAMNNRKLNFNINDYVKHKDDKNIYKILTKNNKLNKPYMVVGPIFCDAKDALYFAANDNDFIPLTDDDKKYIEYKINVMKYNL